MGKKESKNDINVDKFTKWTMMSQESCHYIDGDMVYDKPTESGY